MKHTPGPWELKSDPAHYDTLSSIEGGGMKNRPRCNRELMAEVGGFADVKTQESNARLISAAPDLLEALELIVATHQDGGWPTASIVVAQAAINKAKGIK